MSRLVFLSVLAAAAAGALASVAPASGAPPLTVEASLSPGWTYFADTVTGRIDVLADRRRVDPDSIAVTASFGPWQEVVPARVSAEENGSIARRTWVFTLACLTPACLARGARLQSFQLPQAAITARRLNGSRLRIHRSWPRLRAAGRFRQPTSSDATPTFVLQTRLPHTGYSLNPTWTARVLDLLGAALIAVASGLVLRQLVRHRRRSQVATEGPALVTALALVREAKTRSADDRRRAVGLLARTLPSEQDDLTGTASEVAWAKPEPSPTRLEELASSVEADLDER